MVFLKKMGRVGLKTSIAVEARIDAEAMGAPPPPQPNLDADTDSDDSFR